MVLSGELATNEALKQFKTLGTELLAVSVSDSSNQGSAGSALNNLTASDVLNLKKINKSIVDVAPYVPDL